MAAVGMVVKPRTNTTARKTIDLVTAQVLRDLAKALQDRKAALAKLKMPLSATAREIELTREEHALRRKKAAIAELEATPLDGFDWFAAEEP